MQGVKVLTPLEQSIAHRETLMPIENQQKLTTPVSVVDLTGAAIFDNNITWYNVGG
jgi:hypothetical protein